MNLDRKYRTLYGSQGLLCSVTSGYNAYYLLEHGFDEGESGTLIALFGVVTALCLPLFGRVADRSKRLYWKNMLLLFVLAEIAAWTLLLLCDRKWVVGPTYQITVLVMAGMFPMVNVACFYYEKAGTPVDFGIARGIHSLFYAVGAFFLGKLTVSMGAPVVPLAGLLLSFVMLLPVLRMPYYGHVEREEGKESGETEKKQEKFWREYPCFPILMLGSALIMMVFSLTTTFLISVVREVGGDSSHMGTAISISALAEVPIMLLFTRIVKKIPARKLLVISGLAYVLKSLVLFGAGSVAMIYAAQLLQPFAYGLFNLSSVHFSGKYMKAQDVATGQTLLSMSTSVGSVAGTLIGGWLVAVIGVRIMLLIGSVVALIATFVMFMVMIMSSRDRRDIS